MTNEEYFQGIVEKIIECGRHGPYVVARVEALGSVTFSLNPLVWQGDEWPEPGTWVVLSRIRKKRAGWRAQHGRFVSPSDDEERNNEQQEGATR